MVRWIIKEKPFYRGQRADNGDWVYGEVISRKAGSNKVYGIRTADARYGDFIEYCVKPETIGEYSGYKDRNGVKIFRGDILQCVIMGKDTYGVVIEERYSDYSEWAIVRINENHVNIDMRACIATADVIGNVYGSPEMMKFLE